MKIYQPIPSRSDSNIFQKNYSNKNSGHNIIKLYNELSPWWYLFSPPEDYKAEAAFYKKIILKYSAVTPKTLLELGSGGGNNASFLKKDFQMTLVDLSPGMLAASHKLNPECEHIEGDMRTLRLNRIFDGVFIHDAIMYITQQEDLQKVMETVFVHCRSSGVALFTPDWVSETFKSSTDHGGTDGDERGIRYLEWTYDPDPDDTSYIVEFAILLREKNKETQLVHDCHILGLFRRELWLQLLRDVGFEPRIVFDYDGRELFVGIKN